MHDVCWERWLDEMAGDYFVAAYRPELPAEERLRAASSCRTLIARFEQGGERASGYLVDELASQDTRRRNAAARVLSEVGGRRDLEALTACYFDGQRQWLSPIHLVRGARRQPLDIELAGALGSLPLRVQPALVRALLAVDRPEARTLLRRLVQGGDAGMAEAAVEAVAGWGHLGVLWGVLRRADGTDDPAPALLPAAVQAALRLASMGDRRAVDWLEERTMDDDLALAGLAHVALGLLGWPGCLVELADQLRESSDEALAYAIEAADLLACVNLVPALCDVVALTSEQRGPGLDDNPADSAVRVLERMTGRWVPPDLCGFDVHGNLDAATRRRASLLHRSAVAGLEPGTRLRMGVALGLDHLVEDLVSPSVRRAQAAALQIGAMTGEPLAFEPREDLIANLDVVLAWRERVRTSGGSLGGFVWSQQQVDAPVMRV